MQTEKAIQTAKQMMLDRGYTNMEEHDMHDVLILVSPPEKDDLCDEANIDDNVDNADDKDDDNVNDDEIDEEGDDTDDVNNVDDVDPDDLADVDNEIDDAYDESDDDICEEDISSRRKKSTKKGKEKSFKITKKMSKPIEGKYLTAVKSDGNRVVLFLYVIEKLNMASANQHCAFLKTVKINHGILIYNKNITSSVKDVVANAPSLDMQFELFTLAELQYNCTNFYLSSIYRPLNKEESKAFKKLIGNAKLRRITIADSISRYYNFKRKQIIAITSGSLVDYVVAK